MKESKGPAPFIARQQTVPGRVTTGALWVRKDSCEEGGVTRAFQPCLPHNTRLYVVAAAAEKNWLHRQMAPRDFSPRRITHHYLVAPRKHTFTQTHTYTHTVWLISSLLDMAAQLHFLADVHVFTGSQEPDNVTVERHTHLFFTPSILLLLSSAQRNSRITWTITYCSTCESSEASSRGRKWQWRIEEVKKWWYEELRKWEIHKQRK